MIQDLRDLIELLQKFDRVRAQGPASREGELWLEIMTKTKVMLGDDNAGGDDVPGR